MMFLELSVLLLFISLERKNIKWYILTGVFIGLASITRPIILALLPLYVLWILIYDRPIKNSIVHLFIVIGFTFFVIAPITIRNLIVADDFVPIASSGGINFYIGNNRDADGLTANLPPPLNNNWGISDITYAAEKQTGHKLTASEVSDFWYKKATDWITDNPGAFMKLYLKKLYFMFNNAEVSNNRSLPLFFSRISIFKYNILSFGLIFSLAVLAMIFLIIYRRFSSGILFVCLLVCLYTIVIALFFINARFRLPIVPFIIIFAAAGIEIIADLFYSRKYRSVYIFAIIGGLAASFLAYSKFYNAGTSSVTAGYFKPTTIYQSATMGRRSIIIGPFCRRVPIIPMRI